MNSPHGNPSADILIVTHNSARTLRNCLESVLRFSRLAEIIVIDNASTDETRSILSEYSRHIKTVFNDENIGYARACNRGIPWSSGRYVVLLSPDTVVTPGWLEGMLSHFGPGIGGVGPVSNRAPGLQKVGHYLPGKLPPTIGEIELADMLARQNGGKSVESRLLSRFCSVFPRHVFDEVGLFDSNLIFGNEDLDFSWRLRLRGYRLLVATDVFVHHEGNEYLSFAERTTLARLMEQSTNALYEKLLNHYGEKSVPSSTELWGVDCFKPMPVHPRFQVAPERSLTSIVILTLNQLGNTRLCLESIERHTPLPHELIIVDNGSTDGTVDYLRDYMARHTNVCVVVNSFNRGFAAGNNQGLFLARGEYVLLINNDTIVPHGWLARMLSVLERRPEAGLVGPMSNYVAPPQLIPDVSYHTIDEMEAFAARWSAENAGQIMPSGGRLIAFCLLVRRQVIEDIGGLDEQFGSGNFEDDDFSIRAALFGHDALIAKDAFVHHTGSQTFKGADIDIRRAMHRNWSLFKEKWGIPPERPLEGGYHLSLSPSAQSGARLPLPDLHASHKPDATGRWWEETASGRKVG